ncbi:MAG: hypothetical protein LBH37_00640 [Oscillospiraceae bacterium]|jgi:hypothetical protein|nr:hypothetical protein [Oscillospiraceae bacterium]
MNKKRLILLLTATVMSFSSAFVLTPSLPSNAATKKTADQNNNADSKSDDQKEQKIREEIKKMKEQEEEKKKIDKSANKDGDKSDDSSKELDPSRKIPRTADNDNVVMLSLLMAVLGAVTAISVFALYSFSKNKKRV